MSNICRQFSCYPNKGRESQDFPALRNSCTQKRHVIRGIKLIYSQPQFASHSQPLDEQPDSQRVPQGCWGHTERTPLGGPRATPRGTSALVQGTFEAIEKVIWRERYWEPISSRCTWSGTCTTSNNTLSTRTPACCPRTPNIPQTSRQHEPYAGCVCKCSPSHQRHALTNSKIKAPYCTFSYSKATVAQMPLHSDCWCSFPCHSLLCTMDKFILAKTFKHGAQYMHFSSCAVLHAWKSLLIPEGTCPWKPAHLSALPEQHVWRCPQDCHTQFLRCEPNILLAWGEAWET